MPEPSCTQLRIMWRQMHRMARHSQLTNEIPQFPASYPFGYVSPDDKALMYWTPASFGKVVRQPGQKPVSPIKPGRPSVNGRFAQTPLPRSALGSSYGTVVRSPQREGRPAASDGRRHRSLGTVPTRPRFGRRRRIQDQGPLPQRTGALRSQRDGPHLPLARRLFLPGTEVLLFGRKVSLSSLQKRGLVQEIEVTCSEIRTSASRVGLGIAASSCGNGLRSRAYAFPEPELQKSNK
ncbi:hypothetical protein MTO96_030414 [Rhipicephalus appendiculatus]